MEEIWKDIQGYEGLYQVSNLGRIKTFSKFNNTKKEIMKQKLLFGYLLVNLYKNGKLKTCRVHRLVAQAFIPNTENKPQINHINGIKTDNRVENLEWATRSENMKHAFKNGLVKNNSNSINAMKKANEKHIIQLKNNIVVKEFENVAQASKELNICKNLIYRVACGFRKRTHGFTFRYKEKGN